MTCILENGGDLFLATLKKVVEEKKAAGEFDSSSLLEMAWLFDEVEGRISNKAEEEDVGSTYSYPIRLARHIGDVFRNG